MPDSRSGYHEALIDHGYPNDPPADVREIPLSKGKVALISACDFDEVSKFSWHAIQSVRLTGPDVFYAVSSRGNLKKISMHRFILGAAPGEQVDHRDNDGLNNTRSNIRIATSFQNMYNRTGHKNASTPFKGVSWIKRIQRYIAGIRVDGKTIYLGDFTNMVDAAVMYDTAARKFHGEFACLNFPTTADERIARIEHDPRDEEGERIGRIPPNRLWMTRERWNEIRSRIDAGESFSALQREYRTNWHTLNRIRVGILPTRWKRVISFDGQGMEVH